MRQEYCSFMASYHPLNTFRALRDYIGIKVAGKVWKYKIQIQHMLEYSIFPEHSKFSILRKHKKLLQYIYITNCNGLIHSISWNDLDSTWVFPSVRIWAPAMMQSMSYLSPFDTTGQRDTHMSEKRRLNGTNSSNSWYCVSYDCWLSV